MAVVVQEAWSVSQHFASGAVRRGWGEGDQPWSAWTETWAFQQWRAQAAGSSVGPLLSAEAETTQRSLLLLLMLLLQKVMTTPQILLSGFLVWAALFHVPVEALPC